MKGGCGTIVAVVGILASLTANAETRPRVLIDGAPATELSRARLRGELHAQGFEVHELGDDHSADDEQGAFVARLTVRGRRIAVLVMRRRGASYERHEAEIDARDSDDNLDTAVLRAAEYLRASLLSFGVALPPPPLSQDALPQPLLAFEQPAPAIPAPRREAPPPPRAASDSLPVSGGFGYGFLYSSGNTTSSGYVLPSIAWPLVGRLGVRLGGMFTTTPATLGAAEGSAELRPTSLQAGAFWSPLQARWAMPYLEAGAGLAFVSVTARPTPGYWAEDTSVVTAIPYGGLGVLLLPGSLRVRLAASAGASTKQVHLRFAEREVDTWGKVLLTGSAQVELALE